MHTDLLHLQRYHHSGDAREFQALVHHHAGMVFATARRVTRDAALAEDVAQETFLELARKGRSITESVGAWLHRVAWRRACDVVRAEATRQRYESESAAVMQTGRECTWEELEPLVDEAIAELAPREREILVEHYLEGRTQTEIAARMSLSQPSVSRLLDHSLEKLRSKLKTKGVFCGVGLAALLASGASSQAAPAALIMSLNKIGLSIMGSGAMTTSASTASSGVLGWAGLKLIAFGAAAAAVVAGMVAFDLGQKDSLITAWLGQAAQGLSNPQKPGAAPGLTEAQIREALLEEARKIWAARPKVSGEKRNFYAANVVFEKEPEKRFAAMQAIGMRMSREAYDQLVARHQDSRIQGRGKTRLSQNKFLEELARTWILECPREAVAFRSALYDDPSSWFHPPMVPWVKAHPAEWAAFVETGPDPCLGDYASLWLEELKNPGSIWANSKKAGFPLVDITEAVWQLASTGDWPQEALLHLVTSAPLEKTRRTGLMAMTLGLSDEQLLEIAESGVVQDAGFCQTLRAMAGDPAADFSAAATWLARKDRPDEYQLIYAIEQVAGRFYAQWLKVNPLSALQHSKRSRDEILLETFMTEAVRTGHVNEAFIAESFTSQKNCDITLAIYYLTRAGGDPQAALQSILQSAYVEDQVESARQILTPWAAKSAPDAAVWVAALPASEDRSKLLAEIIGGWVQTEPEAAFAFAQEQGLPLSDPWLYGLAEGASQLPEATLSTMFAAVQNDPQYNTLLTWLLSARYPNDPQQAFESLARYAQPGWQTEMTRTISRWLKNNPSSASPQTYARALLGLDLSQVDPQRVQETAQVLVKNAAAEGKLQPALDWTLRLPASVAPAARTQALANLDLGDSKLRSNAEQWIRSAPIADTERQSLLQLSAQP